MKKAVILSAGFGTRMMPLTSLTPKAMLPLWGKPLIGHIMDMLIRWKVSEVLINLHHAPNPLFEYARQRSCSALRVYFSHEPEILGTGGAIRRIEWFLDSSPFWIINSDTAMDISPNPLINEFEQKKTLAALWLHPEAGPRTVDMQNGKITCFRSKYPCSTGTYTFCGTQLVSPEILNYLPDDSFCTIISAYEQAMNAGHTIRGVCLPNAYWSDIGTPERYLSTHAEIYQRWLTGRPGGSLFNQEKEKEMKRLRQSGVLIDGFAAIGNNVKISKTARIRDSIIFDNADIAGNAFLSKAIVDNNTTVNARASGIVCSADILKSPWMSIALKKLKWNPAATTAAILGKRGSQREFTRLIHKKNSAVFIHYSPERKENCLYSRHARFLLKIGVRVPKVLLDLPGNNIAVIEDMGDKSLTTFAQTQSPAEIKKTYEQLLDIVLLMHGTGVKAAKKQKLPLSKAFSRQLYKWEHRLFVDHFLKHTMCFDDKAVKSVMKDLNRVARLLAQSKHVLIHRDLQSSNVLLPGGQPALIDFQGMRFGPPAYDLASLLCDPYVSLSESIQKSLLDYYAARAESKWQIEQFFWPAAIQRLSQAIGAFARLSRQESIPEFEPYITPALAMMGRALKHLNGLPNLTNLCARFTRH